ncbi:unnamed protein product [Urochloa humidicola]
MGTDDGDLAAAAGEDRISGLPDHLLHSILLGHPGLRTFDAARTSVSSPADGAASGPTSPSATAARTRILQRSTASTPH